jgi:asparagine synthase (glutamine-hydrolysing)
MCGISGKLYFDSDRVVDHEVIRRMSAALAHRGPDGEGVYVKGPVSCVLILEGILQGLQADKRRLLASTRLVSVALGILIAAEK